MKTITLDEMIAEVRACEAISQESNETHRMIAEATAEVREAAKSGKVKILTDYDADGICSAYIMEKTIRAINPECEVSVDCNDRRGHYGLSTDIQGDGESRYIICDMGSNQLNLARERLGENVIIIDHHLIEDKTVKDAFRYGSSYEGKANPDAVSAFNAGLCNPHAINDNDELNAQYCATGLTYRIYEQAAELTTILADKEASERLNDTKLKNTLAVMACIGTATDMVNVLDVNSDNRRILKEGLVAIDNADESNLDFLIGNMLVKHKINDGVTAHQLAFNVGAFLNSASRMSEVIEDNGANLMYQMLTSDASDYRTYQKMQELMEINAQRKEIINQIMAEPAYKEFIEAHCYGENALDNIGVYQLPDNTPAALAGLIAGKLEESTDKAIICLTYSESRGCYTGSGRNPESNSTSLMEFMQGALKDAPIEIKYGGHADALGISSLDDIVAFKNAIENYKDNMKAKSNDERVVLDLKFNEVASDETLAKLQALEPVGIGLQLPNIVVEGTELSREKLFLKNNANWKKVRVKDAETKTTIDITDWSYSAEKYPQSGKKNNEIKFTATLAINDFGGLHTELTTKFDRQFYQERIKEIEAEKHKTVSKNDKSIA